MDAIMAAVVFMAAFFFILTFITDLTSDETGDGLEEQALTIETVVAADRPVSFLKGAEVESRKFSYLTSVPYDKIKDEFGIDGDFCIYFEAPDGGLIRIPDGTGFVVGVGDSRVMIANQPCRAMFGECVDNDGDGYGEGDACIDRDCNDGDNTIHFGAVEICDGKDNDCNPGTVDGEAESGASCSSNIGTCTSGTLECLSALLQCTGITPIPEVCGDGRDNNCNGIVDDGCCTNADLDGFNREGGACGVRDCDDTNPLIYPGAVEVCTDGRDNNCNGATDCADAACAGDPACAVCADADGDTFSPDGGTCGVKDCDDGNGAINPGAAELCTDGLDNNCNGATDCADVACAGDPACACADADGDGFTDSACGGPDCDDGSASINPGAAEVCDGIDNNCDGTIDEGCGVCTDTDGGNAPKIGGITTPTVGPGAGIPVMDECVSAAKLSEKYCSGNSLAEEIVICANLDSAFVCLDENPDRCGEPAVVCTDFDGDTYFGEGGGCGVMDCDDSRAITYPGAPEICDGLDNDCDGSIDEGNPGGGASCGATAVGECAYGTRTCVGGALSCVGEITPTPEVCDFLDNDCDGSTDEGLLSTYYRDADGDSYGTASTTIFSCEMSPGYSLSSTDCNDADIATHPGAWERCEDGIDQDCNGADLTRISNPNIDNDGEGSFDPLFCINGYDCDDTDPDIAPGLLDICDGKDNDCDSIIDNPPFGSCP